MTYNEILTLNDWSMVNTQTNYTLRLIAVFFSSKFSTYQVTFLHLFSYNE